MSLPCNSDSFQFQALSQNFRLQEIRDCIAETHAFDGPEDWLTVSGRITGADWKDCPLLPFQWQDTDQQLLPGILEQCIENLYFSQHSFSIPRRRNATTNRLNALFVDIDQYKGELSKQEALGMALDTIEANGVPAPTFWRDSGRGFYLVWLL